jgi:hypothetical protein
MDPFSELIKSPGVVHSSLESLGMMSSESLASVAAVDRVGNAEASIVASTGV